MNVGTLQQAQKIASGVLAGVRADQLSNSTPCASWDVSQLIDHLVGGQHWAAMAIQGDPPSDSGEGASAGDFTATFDEAAAQAVGAFSEEGALDRTVNPGFGDMSGTAILGLAITDTFVHAWDLATATGQDNDLDAEMARQLLAGAESIPAEFRGPEGAPFGPKQDAPSGATPAALLAAALGRKV